MKSLHLLAVGELLVDLIGHELATNLADTRDFHRYQGGSPANLAANMARLGNASALVACVGNDNLGVYLRERVAEAGVLTNHIATDPHEPTSVVVVSRTQGTPDFIAYRTADCQLHAHHLPDELLGQARLFHTTCFALSRQPAQTTILDAARRATALGCRVSLDANYAPSLWPDRVQARQVVAEYCAGGALVKLSEDDATRLYGEPQANEQIIRNVHDMGASLVCLTLGAEGSLVSTGNDQPPVRLPGKKLDVIDATGAGDAFWAGFLTAWLDGHDAAICAQAGANMAALKLTTIGRLPASVPKGVLFDRA
jgi:sugar/nucleoside kinase (ribokinase family)